ncbi:CotH kinase family protein [Lachnoclostridium phytofermentans]|uniref:Spore coat protein CotH n=1 Tax=Lachnoclostridium phytofermentans (strain ATCC 700394 / DSM 18823 / ISDg) TaxID=357809 RepID=A9KJT5_LACP7|nr:CotH kinase family protein [Lachnoclostridium phytofermentans]ABX41090.1 Spore coat protein CotH [Lachnoclostridium phytofermentans ISDg]
MITSKYIPAITGVIICFCLFICGFVVYAANAFDTTNIPEYQKRLFGDEIITLDIQVDGSDWQSLLDNAQAKEWISADLIINGEKFSGVGVRTKGNSSLSSAITSDGGGRYSLQFKLNKYIKGQTYYGLDTFCINNMMGDATYMKDYLSYEIMNYIGVATPLTNYASVTVNGEDYGFCVALERYEEAFLDRAYSTSAGQLYSVKMGMGMRGNFEDMQQDGENGFPGRGEALNNEGFPDRQQNGNFGDRSQGDGGINFEDRQQGGGIGMGGFGGQGGGSLVYTDDNISSYSAIFENAVFNNASKKDKKRVITALENLNTGTDLEKYFDVDEILRYFAAHTVVVNLDSYISNMAQNYYIYERDGKLSILPWDYGLAFGGFQSGGASSVVNFPIDTPVSGVSMEDRPLLNMLLEVDEYKERYHSYLQQIVEGYFESGLFEKKINELDVKISEYVKNDVSAYYTYDQYKESLPNLIELGHLRAESIKGQLNGTIPSTSNGQNADNSALIDAEGVNLSALGSMGAGGMGGGMGGRPEVDGDFSLDGQGGFPGGNMVDMALMQQAMQILREAGGELTDEVKDDLLELGLSEEQIDMVISMQNGLPDGMNQPGADNGNGGRGGRQGDTNLTNASVTSSQINSSTMVILTVGMLIFLIYATIFIAKPRKNMI